MTTGNALDQFPALPDRSPRSQAASVEHTRAAAEVVAAVQAARAVPRDLEYARRAMRRACSEYSLAQRAFYSYNQGGLVEGATVYLARTLAAIYGNIDWGTKELERSAGQSEVQAWAWDQESNSRKSRSVIIPHVGYTGGSRTLTKAREIDQNNNSVAARAEREMLYAIMDAGFVEEAKRLCRETLERGDGTPLPDRIAEAITAFGNGGVAQEHLEKRIGRAADKWTAQDVADLQVLFESLKRREVTKEEAFPTLVLTSEDIVNQSAGRPDPGEPDPTLDPNWGKQ